MNTIEKEAAVRIGGSLFTFGYTVLTYTTSEVLWHNGGTYDHSHFPRTGHFMGVFASSQRYSCHLDKYDL